MLKSNVVLGGFLQLLDGPQRLVEFAAPDTQHRQHDVRPDATGAECRRRLEVGDRTIRLSGRHPAHSQTDPRRRALRLERGGLFEILGRLRELLILHIGFAGQRQKRDRRLLLPGQDWLERSHRLRVLPLLHVRRRENLPAVRIARIQLDGRVQEFLGLFRVPERKFRDASQQSAGNGASARFPAPGTPFVARPCCCPCAARAAPAGTPPSRSLAQSPARPPDRLPLRHSAWTRY